MIPTTTYTVCTQNITAFVSTYTIFLTQSQYFVHIYTRVAIVLPKIVEDYGIGYMFYAIMLAGLIQILFGCLRLGLLVRMIPHPVMVGFCNG